MEILIKRTYNCKTYCISHVYIDGSYICDAIEDTDRGLDESMSVAEIMKKKVNAKTAIPTGNYNILMNVVSPKFYLKPYYKKFCGGKVPRFEYVKGFSGVLFHCGINENSSAGCIILGQNKVKGKVINSQMCFENFYNKLKVAYKIGEKITCKIVRTFQNVTE